MPRVIPKPKTRRCPCPYCGGASGHVGLDKKSRPFFRCPTCGSVTWCGSEVAYGGLMNQIAHMQSRHKAEGLDELRRDNIAAAEMNSLACMFSAWERGKEPIAGEDKVA